MIKVRLVNFGMIITKDQKTNTKMHCWYCVHETSKDGQLDESSQGLDHFDDILLSL